MNNTELAEKIAKELETIRGRNINRVLTPEDVVAYAKRYGKSALHQKFEWSLKKAAQEHWLQTARKLIRVHYVVIDSGDGNKEPMRMYFSPSSDGNDEKRGYLPTEQVINDRDARHALVLAQIERLWNIYKSYPLAELKPIGAAIERCRRANQVVSEAAE